MAKKRRSRKKKSDNATSEELIRSGRDERAKRRRGGKGILSRKWMFGLILLALFLFFLPALVVRTPLKQMAIDRALAGFKGDVTVGSISCGWISPTELNQIKAVDENGELLFSVESVKTRKSLTSMLNTTDLGTFEIVNPMLNLKVRPDGSNLEDALADLLDTEASEEPSPAIRLSISGAAAIVTDTTNGREYELDKVASTIDAFQPDEAPLVMEFEGVLLDAAVQGQGDFKAKVVVDAGKEEIEFQNGLVQLQSSKLPIGIASPLLTRFVEPIAFAGTMDGNVTATWENGGSSTSVQLEPASFTQLVVAAPNRIGTDQIRLTNAWLQGFVNLTPQTVEADQLVCQTDVGSLKANGKVNWEEFAAVEGARIPANNFEAEGQIHLAPLIAMLPNTLPLQDGMHIESGKVDFNASSRIEGTDRKLVMNVQSTGLTAIRNGQRLNWDKPARVVAAIRQTSDNSIYIESLDCITNFLTLRGSATTNEGEFRIEGDLKSAMAEASQFFDFGETRIEGIVDGEFAWRFDGSPTDKLTSRPLGVGGRFKIDKPLVNLPGQTSWAEDELNVVVQAAGQMLPVTTAQSRSIRLDTGKLELVNARQSFVADLAEPLVNPSANSTWNLECRVGGNVQNWLSQISTFIPVAAEATGVIDATALVQVNPKSLTVQRSNFEFTNLDFQGYGLTLSEPQMIGDAVLGYDIERGILQVSDASLASSAISARGQQIIFDTDSTQGSLSGDIAFRADVNRCISMFAKPAPDAIHWFGTANGTVNLQTNANSIGGTVAINVDELVAAQFQARQSGTQNVSAGGGSWNRLLEEKVVKLDSQLTMDRSFNRVDFQNTQLQASAANVIASGSISDLTTIMNTNIQGTWQPDWQRLKPLLDSMLGGLASIEGVQGGGFQMAGPIFNPNSDQPGQSWIHPNLQVAANASWQGGAVLGMPIGGSNLDLQLQQGVAAVNTQPIQFGGGTVRLAPRLDLNSSEMVLFMPQGRVVDNIQLTQEICRGWMKYVAPMLADATAAEGRFSIDAGNVQVPLSNLSAANVQGQAVLHGANVGPGPLSQQLIAVVAQVKALAKGQPLSAATASGNSTWIRMPEQNVPFAVQQGRVHHQGMQFQIDDVLVQTTGSVGLDQSMQMVAQIPILDSWVGTSRWTQGLRGQTLQIPIGGTVSKPQVDNRALQQMSQQLVQQAAGAAINQEVQGQVQGLLDKGNQRLEEELTKGLQGLFGGDR